MPPLHPLIIHFPIALFILAVVFDFITAYRTRRISVHERDTLNMATRLIMVFGFVGTIAAVVSGEWLKAQRGKFLPQGLLGLHQTLAIVFTLWYGIMLVFRLRSMWYPTNGYLLSAVVGFILLVAVGHTGGSMVWPATPVAGSLKPGGSPTSTAAPVSGNAKSNSQAGSSSKSAASQPTDKVLLKEGDNNPQVAKLQQELTQLGFFSHVVTNYYGPVTAAAVKSFQHHNHLNPTGTLDENTAQAILSQLNTANSYGTSTTGQTANANSPSPSTASIGSNNSSGGSSNSTLDQQRIQKGYQLFVSSCQSCHSLGMAQQYFGQLSNSQWQQVVNQMQAYAGGNIPDTKDIIDYLEHQH